ncbi:cytosolic carboxypeptidase 1-like [Pollicipes pollicipes]|uniref:cytosolic carboxypeptidase 1-like n=1 Tax=Pollicipes pollicipes TaxID=41117 RepID=UPI0018858EAF|nr:cytosolic carboxypeptidase 1-like [Pollicipes pollicipes]
MAHAAALITLQVHGEPGREALMEAKVCEAMQSFLRCCPTSERHDLLFCRAANTILRCVSKWSLPVERLESPIKFTPPSLPKPEASGDGAERTDDESGSETEPESEVLQEWSDRRGEGDSRRQYRDIYRRLAQNTRHVAPFVKLAYPDLVGAVGVEDRESLAVCDRLVCRKKVQGLVDDAMGQRKADSKVVYDYDFLVQTFPKATAAREYDLVICPDVGSSRHQQWFYFEVSNMLAGEPYTFNLINNEKLSCEYQAGMRPVLFSVKEAVRGRPHWVRVGTDVFYYRNAYRRPGKQRVYCTASFTVTFPHTGDVCYLAFHYPYTYTRLQTMLELLEGAVEPEKEVVFLTARIHPGESGASWAMEGTLRFLLSAAPEAEALRDRFIFKLVPMLNVAGVVNGCHRCGLTDEDLNRRWKTPDPLLHPVIYRAKTLMEYSTFVLKRVPYLFCDYHGHSCRKNIFLYGCSNRRSWLPADRQRPDNDALVSCLPQALYRVAPAFSLRCCHLTVERSRETTARVVVWRELGVQRSYTMESSYCGCDQGPYQVTDRWRPQEDFEREFAMSSATNSDVTESDDDTDDVTSSTVTSLT